MPELGEPKTTDYCVRCGHSPDSGVHLIVHQPGGHYYEDPRLQALDGDRAWRLEEVLTLVRELERLEIGWHFAVTGGVLFDGWSAKDADIIAYPHDSTRPDTRALRRTLRGRGWKLTHSVRWMHANWRKKGSKDRKHVEAWRTADGRRVDLFILGVTS